MSTQLAAVDAPERSTNVLAPRPAPVCRHCAGSGREPSALVIEFSRAGDLRGEQQRMAEETGISAPMLSMIMAGTRAPGVLTLIKIARYYRTTVDRVLRVPAIWRRVHQQPE